MACTWSTGCSEGPSTEGQGDGGSTEGSADRWTPDYVGIDASWETAVGNSDDAVQDGSGSRWDAIEGMNTSLLTVVDLQEEGVSGIDGSNVMRMGVNAEDNRMMVENTAFNATGDCRYTRMYQYVVCIEQAVAQIHHFEDWDDAGSTNFFHRMYAYEAGDGRWSVSPQSYADQSTPFAACPAQATHGGFEPVSQNEGLMALRATQTGGNADEHDPNGLE